MQRDDTERDFHRFRSNLGGGLSLDVLDRVVVLQPGRAVEGLPDLMQHLFGCVLGSQRNSAEKGEIALRAFDH